MVCYPSAVILFNIKPIYISTETLHRRKLLKLFTKLPAQ